jgi:glutathione S-transferase
MELVAIVTALMLVQYMVFGFLVGKARGRTGVKAPAVGGNPEFERYFRAHQNSLEQLVATLPALWLFAMYVHTTGAAILGVAFLVGRILYFRAYVADPASRGPGFGIGFLATAVLILGGLGGAAWRLLG